MQSNAEQCKAKQSKEKQCKAKQNKAKRIKAVTCDTVSLLLPSPRNRYMWHLSPFPAKAQIPLHVKPFAFSLEAPETVTCDTFSQPLHVTPFPFFLQPPEAVTCDTFSLSPPNPRSHYMWHLLPCSLQTPETLQCPINVLHQAAKVANVV